MSAQAAAGTSHVVVVPEPVASRLDAMVSAGEFRSFGEAAVAMIQFGLVMHDQRGGVAPGGAGPAPPPPRSGPMIPPASPTSGPPGHAKRGE